MILDSFPFNTESEEFDEELESIGAVDSDDEVINSASPTSSLKPEKPRVNRVFFRCHKCPYQTQIQHLLDRHVTKHLYQLFQCPSCDYSDEDHWTFVDHWVMHHQQADIIQCSFCSFNCNHPRALKLHITDHLPVEMIDCSMCEFSSDSADFMKSHIEAHHTEVYNYEHFDEMMNEHELIEHSQNIVQPVLDSPESNKNSTKAKSSKETTDTDDSKEMKPTFAVKTLKSGCGTAGHYNCFCSPCSPQQPELESPLSPEFHWASTPKDNWEKSGLPISLQLGFGKSGKRHGRSSKCKQQQSKRALKTRRKSQPLPVRPSRSRPRTRPNRSDPGRADPAKQQNQQTQRSKPNRADSEPGPDNKKAAGLKAPNDNARRKYLCRICNYSTDAKHRITYHNDHIHYIKYKCQYCPVINTKYGLMKHVKMEHGVVLTIRSGRWRNFTRIRTGKLVKDIDSCRGMKHSGQNSRHSEAGNSEQNDELQTNQSIPKLESQSRILKCYNCSYKTKFKSLMRRHVLLHLPEGQFSCTKCNFKENRTAVFANHVKSHSQSKGSFDCCFCSFSAANMISFIMHLNTHRGVDSYYCSKCKYSSPGSASLHRHVQVYHVEKHTCPECHDCGSKSWVLWHIKKRHPTFELMPLKLKPKPLTQKKISSSGVASNLRSRIATEKAFCRKIKDGSRDTVKKEVLCCKTCEYQTEKEDLLTRHEAKHILLKCPICGLVFRKRHTFALHLIKHNPPKSRFKCFYCQHVSKCSRDVCQHLAVHLAALKEDKCPKCEFSCLRPRTLRQHITDGSTGSNSLVLGSSKSLSKTSEVIPSTSADIKASDSRTATASELTESKKAKLSFEGESTLEYHKKTYADEPKHSLQSAIQYSDQHTSRSAIRSSDRHASGSAIHSSDHHTSGSELYQCNDCRYKTKIKPLMRNHVRLHLPEGQFVCSVCGFKENKTSPFVNHLKTHSASGDAFKCCYCTYSTEVKYCIEQHLCHHRSVGTHYCSKCEYSCAQIGGLTKHMANYHGKLYACSVCPKVDSKFRIVQHFKRCHPSLSFKDHPPHRAQLTQKKGNAVDAASDTTKRGADKKLSPPKTVRGDGESIDLLETQKSGMAEMPKYSNTYISPKRVEQTAADVRFSVKSSGPGEIPKQLETPSKSKLVGKHSSSFLNLKNGIATKKQDDGKSLQHVPSTTNDTTTDNTDVSPNQSFGSSVYSQFNLFTGSVQSEDSAVSQLDCPDCDFRTIREDLYQRHVAKHAPLVCLVCSLSIKDPSHFTAHLISHNQCSKQSASTPYKCHYCGHVSKRSANLFCHLAVHLDALKKFDCPLCEFCTNRGDLLRSHFSNHSKSPRNITKTLQFDKEPLKSETDPEATLDTTVSPSQSMIYSGNQKSADSSQIERMQDSEVSLALLNSWGCSENRSDQSFSKTEANVISVSDQNIVAETIQTLSSGGVISSRLASNQGNRGINESCQESTSTSHVYPTSSNPGECPSIVPVSSTIMPLAYPAVTPDISVAQPLSQNNTTSNTNIPETQASSGQSESWKDFINRYRKIQ